MVDQDILPRHILWLFIGNKHKEGREVCDDFLTFLIAGDARPRGANFEVSAAKMLFILFAISSLLLQG